MQFRDQRKRRATINMTSLIDVLFLLLIFFMVSTTFVKAPGISLDLPAAESSDIVDEGPLALFITASGEVYVNDEFIPKGLLVAALKKKVSKKEDTRLVLKADQAVSYGKVVEVLDIVKQSGIRFLTIATRIPPPDSDS